MKQTLVIKRLDGKVINTFEWNDKESIYKNLYYCYKTKVERPNNVKRVSITKPYYEKTICKIVFNDDVIEPTIYEYTTWF